MKCNATVHRMTLIFIMSMLLLACRKGPVWYPGCDCPTPPRCQVQQTVMYNFNPIDSVFKLMPEFRVRKSFAPNGTVKLLDLTIPPWSPMFGLYTNLKVTYKGNRVIAEDPVVRTYLSADLDNCGRAIRSSFTSAWHEPGDTTYVSYVYDKKGNLTDGGAHFEYDQYGNLIKVSRSATQYLVFTYDYSRPVKGAFYDYDSDIYMMGGVVLAALGHTNQQTHHLLTSIRDHDWAYPEENRDYYNQVVNQDGYLVSYDFVWGGSAIARYVTTWACGSAGPSKPDKY